VRTEIRLGRSSASRGLDRRAQALEVVAVVHPLGVPPVGVEAPEHVLGEGQVGLAVDRDLVVVVEVDQATELEVTGQRGRLGGDALHQVAVGHDRVHRRGRRRRVRDG
jgi:hypothetical protein